jgi:hypothetical protein
MGAMRFGLWEAGDRSGGGAMTLPRAPRAAPAPARDRHADPGASTRPRSAASRRRADRHSETTVVAARRTVRRPVSAPSARPTSRRSAEQPASAPATEERAAPAAGAQEPGRTKVAVPAIRAPVPQVPPPGGSLPQVVRDVPGTLGRTAETVMTAVGRTADTAQGAVGEVAAPATAPLVDALPPAARPAVTGVVAGVLPGAKPSP